MKWLSIVIALIVLLGTPVYSGQDDPSNLRIKSLEGIIVFSHAIHLRLGIRDCDSCHRWVKEGSVSVHKHCRGCHVEGKVGPTRCQSCHKN